MTRQTRFMVRVASFVALGGFLMGFDASVISGVVGFIEPQFRLSKLELGWAVASLSLTATLAMMVSGPLSDRIGRRPVLVLAAGLFLVSAIASALAPNFAVFVAARMLGGLGVGAALLIAPMYIAELAPAAIRGRLVSFNQLNIVIGISAAFFSNYLVLKLGQSDLAWAQTLGLGTWNWRWMLGLEALPALLYLVCLRFVPESPRWLLMHGREAEAIDVLSQTSGTEQAMADLEAAKTNLAREANQVRGRVRDLFQPSLRLVLFIGITVAILQQLSGINAVFFYAPMIFEQSGISRDASFLQAVLVGLTNLAFTVVAMALIDRLGRRALLLFGTGGIAVCMFLLAFSFQSATYRLSAEAVGSLPESVDTSLLSAYQDRTFDSDLAFKAAMNEALGEDALRDHESALVAAAISINPLLVLLAILGFVASFAVSLGPVMWVLFSEIFPNAIRGVAISVVGLINSAVSFGVQFAFPLELATLGTAGTFALFGVFAVVGLVIVARILPETKGRSLEELEEILVRPRG